jgi:SMC interacting uncharacterized protein involved in chromosome segregation
LIALKMKTLTYTKKIEELQVEIEELEAEIDDLRGW